MCRVADAAAWASPGSTWMQGSNVSIGAAGDALTATALAIVPRALARRLCPAPSSPKPRSIVPFPLQVSLSCHAPRLLFLSAQARLLTRRHTAQHTRRLTLSHTHARTHARTCQPNSTVLWTQEVRWHMSASDARRQRTTGDKATILPPLNNPHHPHRICLILRAS